MRAKHLNVASLILNHFRLYSLNGKIALNLTLLDIFIIIELAFIEERIIQCLKSNILNLIVG
jgi:hypothetical protein